MRWDPTAYATFGDERTRPFHDLIARIGATAPGVVVDLGCGPGSATLTLAQRWPRARIIGVDSSPEMIEAARAADPQGRVEWLLGDLRDWSTSRVDAPVDVLVTNAALQWIEGHERLLAPWVEGLAPGGWFAMQVPGNFGAPSHALMREIAARQPSAQRLREVLRLPASAEPGTYLAALAGPGRRVDAWSTTYLHVLDPRGQRANPVLEWVSGTGLRPVLQALVNEAERSAYLADYGEALLEAYPRTEVGVVLPFRRIFAVAHREA